jgi:hypothetical protein
MNEFDFWQTTLNESAGWIAFYNRISEVKHPFDQELVMETINYNCQAAMINSAFEGVVHSYVDGVLKAQRFYEASLKNSLN